MADSGACTNCGAALPPADALGLITCPSCGRVTKLPGSTPTLDEPEEPFVPDPEPNPTPAPPAPPAPALGGWPAPPVAAPPPGGQWSAPAGVAGAPPTPPPTRPPGATGKGSGSRGDRSAARRVGCAVVPIAIVLVVTFGIFGAVRSCDISTTTSSSNPFDFDTSKLTLSGSGTVLSHAADSDDAEAIMLLQTTEGSETTRHVARIRFTGDRSELVWQSEALPEDSYRVEVAVVDDTVFAGVDDEVYALDAETGETNWTATLRDKLTAGCEDCFAAVGGKVVIRTTDAYVTAFAPRSAEPAWTKRLNSTSGSISVVGDRLFIVDEPEADDAPVPVALTDPANGKTIRSTTPRCPKSSDTPWDLAMAAGDEVLAVPGSTDVLSVFGFGDGCVVRWDPATSAITWTSRLTGMGSFDSDEVITGRNDLVIGTTGSPIITVFLPNGKARVLDEASGDVDAKPGRIVGRTLVAYTVTTRGTPKGGLAAWDLSTGERTWSNTALGTAQPVSSSKYHSSDALFDGSPRSLLVPEGDGLNVFVFEGEERTFSVSPLDLATGELGTEVRRAFYTRYDTGGTVSLTIEGQSGERLIVSIDNLLQSLPVSGKGDVVPYPEKN